MESKASLKWYDRKWLVIWLIIVLFPIGLLALARSSSFNRLSKFLVMTFYLLFVMSFFGAVFYKIYQSKQAGFEQYSDYVSAKKLGIDNAEDYQSFKEEVRLQLERKAIEQKFDSIEASRINSVRLYLGELSTYHRTLTISLMQSLHLLQDALEHHEKRSFWDDKMASEWRTNYIQITHLLLALSGDDRMKKIGDFPKKDVIANFNERLDAGVDLDQIIVDIDSFENQIKPFAIYAIKLEEGLSDLEGLIGFPPDRISEYYSN